MKCSGKYWSENRVGGNHPRYSGGNVEMTCDGCGDTYEVNPANVEKARFCSYSCLGDVRMVEMRGEKNTNFNPDLVDEYGPNWHEQRRKCLKRDNYKCIDCDATQEQHNDVYGCDLIVHHVTPRRRFVTDGELDWESANRLSNLRTVCHPCHGRWEGIPVVPL